MTEPTLLAKLQTLAQETDVATIEQAQDNVQKRLQNAIKHTEPTMLWIRLAKLLETLKQLKELMY